MRIVKHAYAKINWAIDVIGKRPDGYHDIDMLVETIELHDDITFEHGDELTLDAGTGNVPRDDRNLVIKAAKALRESAGVNYGARITLRKRIPVRAGLGGGSADCAATLIALNELWKLSIPLTRLTQIGATLGKDVPFCMGRGGARVSGTGEKLLRLKSGMNKFLVIVHPGSGLSTQDVYQKWDAMYCDRSKTDMDCAQKALMDGNIEMLKASSHNALQPAAIELMPEISKVISEMEALGSGFVRMTGSGSAVFAAFDSVTQARNAIAGLKRRAILTRTI